MRWKDYDVINNQNYLYKKKAFLGGISIINNSTVFSLLYLPHALYQSSNHFYLLINQKI